MSTVGLQCITNQDPREAPGWLLTILTKQQRCTTRAAQGFRDRLHRAQHRCVPNRTRTDSLRFDEHVAGALPQVATGRTLRSRREQTPIHTLVSDEESFLQKLIMVSLTYVSRGRRNTPMFGNAVIAVGQAYHIRTKPVLVVGMGAAATV